MNLNKILIGLIALVIIIGGFFYLKSRNQNMDNNNQGNQNDAYNQNNNQATDQNPPPAPNPTPTPTPATTTPTVGTVATIETSMGNITVTLDPKAAPLTVANFVKLATTSYCNSTKFHRVIKGFVIQGCDPNSIKGDASTWGQGGPGYTVPAEIGLKANVGAIGMASTAAKGPSSGSQFFIVTQESEGVHASLDGNYTFFGYVTSGMDIVTKIESVPVQLNSQGEKSQPVTAVIINKITIK